ncbi:triacylglycerol lipase [Morganella morganii]|uniref:lipase family protein n=1 Tax=Morganella morganii TaxID=582 RepID=UPI00062C19EB|nr:lipase family protein [Morganella morganii]KKY64757.1 triacylglycerol lipase [Morganella morganii]
MQSENAESVQRNDPYCTNCNARKAWIEIVLVDELNRPVAGIPYTLAVSGGETRPGISGPDGLIREENLPLTSVILKTDAQKLTDEMENRLLREGRGAEHSEVKALAALNNHGYRYAVIGELCDRAPDIENWNKEAFGLPRYHFKSESDFPGIRFSGNDFNRRHIIEICPFRAWSLILNHTTMYDLVNAHNLAFLALMAYRDEIMLDPDEPDTDMRPSLDIKNTVTSFFYNTCFDLSDIPSFEDGRRFYGIATDVPFRERYYPAVFLDSSQSENREFFEHDTQMFFVENNTQIIAAWRGTAGKRDLVTDASYRPVPYSGVEDSKAKAHYGFLNAYRCMEKYFKEKLQKIEKAADDKKLFICAHSLGGTAALLHAADLKAKSPVVYTYGMPRVFTKSAVEALKDINHFRHVNDADAVTTVPSDTNMDNWFFELWGPFGVILGMAWTIATSPTLPIQKSLPELGEVFWHHGKTVSFFQARQIGEAYLPAGKGAAMTRARWRFNSGYKFYLVPDIRKDLDEKLRQQQEYLISTIDKNVLEDIFPQHTNPNLDSVMFSFLDHSMVSNYMSLISNQVLRQLNENNTPYAKRKRNDFISKIDHSDAYPPNVERNNTFIHLESVLGELFKHQHSNAVSQTALTRFTEKAHEFTN